MKSLIFLSAGFCQQSVDEKRDYIDDTGKVIIESLTEKIELVQKTLA